MAGKGRGLNEADVLALLHEVHGTEGDAQSQAVDVALRTLELTHRQASMAMRHFERSGRTGQQGGGLPLPSLEAEPAARPRPQLGEAAKSEPAVADRAKPARPRRGEEVTAVYRPDAAKHLGPRHADELARANGPARTGGPDEAEPAARPAAGGPPSSAAAQAPSARPDDAAVYAGRGAEVVLKEPTQTRIMPRRKL